MKISDEQKSFLVKNYDENSIEQLNVLFFQRYGIKIHKTDLAKYCRSIGLKRGQGAPGRKRKKGLTRNVSMKKEKDDFIRENIDNLSFSELCNSFRSEFGENTSNNAINMRISRIGYSRGCGRMTDKPFDYKKEHDFFLIENFGNFTYEELKIEFDKKFGTDISVYSLKHHCLQKLELRHIHRLEIGEETKRQKRAMVKISNGNGYYNYKDKARIAYEKEYGEIPKGYCVVCLDGNKDNCDTENLCLLSRSELSVLSGSKWLGKERDNMELKIKYAQLMSKIKESEENR